VKTHAGDPRIAHQACGIRMRQVQVLEHAGRNTGACECLEETLGAQRSLVRSFKHHRVARYQRRQHGN